MDKDSFDPRTFFALHDLNGDGYWNADELEALFQKELEKVYNETDPDDDPRERYWFRNAVVLIHSYRKKFSLANKRVTVIFILKTLCA